MNYIKEGHQKKIVAFIGPLPSPDILASYAKISPDLVDKIVDLALKEGESRRFLESQTRKSEIAHIKRMDKEYARGQWFAFIISLIVILAGTFLIVMGDKVSGLIFGGFGIASLASVFISSKKSSISR